MKAIIVTGGKQYTVSEGDVLFIEKLNAEAEATNICILGMADAASACCYIPAVDFRSQLFTALTSTPM